MRFICVLAFVFHLICLTDFNKTLNIPGKYQNELYKEKQAYSFSMIGNENQLV